MKRKAQGLPVNVLILIIIALVVLVLTLVFYSLITGKHIFPDLLQKIKTVFGMWNATKLPVK